MKEGEKKRKKSEHFIITEGLPTVLFSKTGSRTIPQAKKRKMFVSFLTANISPSTTATAQYPYSLKLKLMHKTTAPPSA